MISNDIVRWQEPEDFPATGKRLLIGPLNSAGQATGWAGAVTRFCVDASAHSYTYDRPGLGFGSDYLVPKAVYLGGNGWRAEFSEVVISRYTHVLLESNRPLFGLSGGREVAKDLALLLKSGVEVALIAHGSDVRVPSRHVELEPWSHFRYMDPKDVDYLERLAGRSSRVFNEYPGPVYVSTPDLLEFVPKATWCPVVVEPEKWQSQQPVLERAVPVVAHAPSKSGLKGSDLIDPLLEQLESQGIIEYRRVQGLSPDQMPAVFADADIVIDQLLVGSYGVTACEAMASGRVVLGHVSKSVREHVLITTGLELPIVEVTPDDIAHRITEICADREQAKGVAEHGPAFVSEVHDGRFSARVLGGFLTDGDGTSEDWRPTFVAPKVVMMAGNDIASDARVMKYAQTVARWGISVTALGVAGQKLRGTERIGPVLVRCPVMPLRPVVPRRSFLQRIVPWFSTESDRQRASDRLAFDARELRSSSGKAVRDRSRLPLTTKERPVAHMFDRAGQSVKRRTLRIRRIVLRARGIPLAVSRRRTARSGPDMGVGKRRQWALRWYAITGAAGWRKEMAEAKDWERILGPILDKAKPDLIHVHDVFMLGVAAQAARRAALRGRTVKIVYDAHEYIPGIPVTDPRRIAAYSHLEREFIGDVDRIITVSEPLADLLMREHDLVEKPDVVLNAPVEAPFDAERPGIRDVIGLDPDVTLLVYAGAVNRARGLATAVEALPSLAGIHIALVSRPGTITRELTARAEVLGVADRFHVTPYVDPEFVPQFLSGGTIGLTTALHVPNYEIGVPNKFCEYIVAGLPIVTSDLRAQADLVRSLDIGAVYRAGDTEDFVRAVRDVLKDHKRIAERIANDPALQHRFSWSPQAEVIRDVYESMLGELPAFAWSPNATAIRTLVSGRIPKEI